MPASITTGKKENNSSARGHPDPSWTVMNRMSLEARKFCKLFPKRKANEFQLKMTVDTWKASQSLTPRLASLCPVRVPSIPMALSLHVCGHQDSENSGFAQIHAGPVSKLPPNTAPHCSCPLMLSKSAIATGHSAGRSHSGSQGPLVTHTLHCLSLGRPSAPGLCLRGLAHHPAGLLLCERLLHVPGDLSSLAAGREPHCSFHLCSE